MMKEKNFIVLIFIKYSNGLCVIIINLLFNNGETNWSTKFNQGFRRNKKKIRIVIMNKFILIFKHKIIGDAIVK